MGGDAYIPDDTFSRLTNSLVHHQVVAQGGALASSYKKPAPSSPPGLLALTARKSNANAPGSSNSLESIVAWCRPVGIMQRSSSFVTSWADQWDTGADPSPRARERGQHDGGGKKQGGVEKTKAAAATGLRKVKEGTAIGFQWIKDKCQKKNGGGKKQEEGSGIVGF